MKKEQIKKEIIKQFTFWKDEINILGDAKVTVRDFDCWLGGYISGLSMDMRAWTEKEVEEIINSLVESDVAKEIGITGTKASSLSFYFVEKEDE